MPKFILLFLISFTFILSNDRQKSEQLTNKAWEHWGNYEFSKAENQFRAAIKADKSYIRPRLALSYLYQQKQHFKKAWTQFKEIIELDPNYHAYLYAVWSTLMIRNLDFKKAEELYEYIIENPDKDGILLAMAHEYLGQIYEQKNEFSDAREAYKNIHAINSWKIIGPFDNSSESGYDRSFPPETKFDTNASYIGKNGIPTKWFSIRKIRNDRWIDFTRYFEHLNSIYYANTFVFNPEKQNAFIRVGTSGSVKTFLNDELIIHSADENNNDLDTYITKVALKKGWNRILIKIGSSEINRSNFLLRITNEAGEIIKGLRVNTKKQAYTSSKNQVLSKLTNFAENFFKNAIIKEPKHLENYLLLSDAYLRNDKANEAEAILEKALSIAKNFPALKLQLIEAYIRGEKNDLVNTIIEDLYKQSKEIPLILNNKFSQFMGNKDYDNAKLTLNHIKSILPNTAAFYEKEVHFYSQKKDFKQVYVISSIAGKKFPNNWDFVLLNATIALKVKKNSSKAISLIEDYLDDNYNTSAVNTLANLYFQTGKTEKALDLLKERIENYPAASGFLQNLSQIYLQGQIYSEAEKYSRLALELAPGSSSFWATLGNVLYAMEKKVEASNAYKNALLYSPTNYEVREKLREIEGKGSIFNEFPKSNIDSLINNSPSKSDYPNDPALILASIRNNVIYKNAASEFQEEILIRPFNKSGIDQYKEYYIPFNSYTQTLSIDKAIVHKKDGSEIEADINQNHVVFKSLEEEDFIFLKYRIKNYYSGKLSNHFWDDYYFNSFHPMRNITYRILAPSSFKFNYNTLNMPKEAKKSELSKQRILYEWGVKNEAALNYEIGMPPLYDIGKVLYISTIPSWDFVSNWYADLATSKTRNTVEIKKQVATILSEKPNLTKSQQIEAIHNYIVKNIRYSSVSFRQSGLVPQKARRVLNTKIGDCKDTATLFISMLREIGVDAYHVLVSTRDNGRNPSILPTINFNHCIAAYEDNGKTYYTDLTANSYALKILPEADVDAFSLRIKNEANTKPFFLKKNEGILNSTSRVTSVTFNTDNSVLIKRSSQKNGLPASEFRSTYIDISKIEQKKTLQESLTKDYNQATLNFFNIEELTDLNEKIKYEYEFIVNNYIKKAGAFLIAQIPWTDELNPSKAISYDKRQFPINFWYRNEEQKEELTIVLPKHYRPVELKDVYIDTKFGSYTVRFKRKKNIITANRKLTFKQTYIKVEDYDAFKKFYSSVVEEDEKQLLLKK